MPERPDVVAVQLLRLRDMALYAPAAVLAGRVDLEGFASHTALREDDVLMISSDPDDHYNDNPSDHPYGFDVPERCVECRQLYPCTTILADKPDAAARVKLLRFWRKECRCPEEWTRPDQHCPIHEPCDDHCGVALDPGEDVPELQRALQHEREHYLMGGCSHGNWLIPRPSPPSPARPA